MKDIDKILKESFNFSKLEGVRFKSSGIFYQKEVSMNRFAKITLVVSILLIVVTVSIVFFYDQISSIQKKPISEVQKQEESIVAKVPDINAIVTMVIGDVKVQNVMKLEDVEVGYKLKQGDTIIASDGSECEVQIDNKSVVRIAEKTKVSFEEIVYEVGSKKQSIVELVKGNVKTAVKKLSGEEFKVKTSTAIAAVRGTKFSVTVDDKGNTKVVVSEGKVSVGVRSKVVENLQKNAKEKLAGLESVAEVIVKENESILVKQEQQKKVDEKIQKSISSEEVKGDVKLIYEKVRDAVKGVSLESFKDKASVNEIRAIENSVSKNLLLESDKSVKVRFVPDAKIKDGKLFVDNVEISKLPVEKLFEYGREYKIKVQVGDEVVFSEDMKFTESKEIVIKAKGIEEKKVKKEVVEKQQEVIQEKTMDRIGIGSKSIVEYGKMVYHGKNSVFVTPSGVAIFNGSNIRNVKISGTSYGFSDNFIASLSKDENDYIVLSVFDLNGNLVRSVNLGESTRGSLVVSRPVVLGGKVFVASISGIHVVNINDGSISVANVGSMYSEIAAMGKGVVGINEIGEVYFVSEYGESKKIGQLPVTTIRKAYVNSDGKTVFVMSKGVIYIVREGKDVVSVNIGIKDSLPLVYENRLVVYSEDRIVILDVSGNILNRITLMGTLNGIPYVGNGYVLALTTDGLYVYSVKNGQQIARYDAIGNIVTMINGKAYVIGDSSTTILDIK